MSTRGAAFRLLLALAASACEEQSVTGFYDVTTTVGLNQCELAGWPTVELTGTLDVRIDQPGYVVDIGGRVGDQVRSLVGYTRFLGDGDAEVIWFQGNGWCDPCSCNPNVDFELSLAVMGDSLEGRATYGARLYDAACSEGETCASGHEIHATRR
jgi:hypothetical protein